jgi:hypothetical protein
VSSVEVSTSHGVNTVNAAAAYPAARDALTDRASRNAGTAALGKSRAFRRWPARTAVGASNTPKNGASRSGYSWLSAP